MLLFGVVDDRSVVGLEHAQQDAEAISRFIKERITPLPQFVLHPMQEKGKDLLALEVASGRSTPYYYKADGVMEAYIRVGNESIPAPDYVLNELILKGTNRSFDALVTDERREDYSFTLLEATYRERTGLRFEPSDYVSFGLVDKNGFLTNAGRLLADQHIVYNSRIFCTRWNGWKRAPSSTTPWTIRSLRAISFTCSKTAAISSATIPRSALPKKRNTGWTNRTTRTAP